MNAIIESLCRHRSIRQYEDTPLTDEQIAWIVRSAQSASTSSMVQAYSIIGIRSPETKRRLADLAGNQPQVADNGHFFVFCADLHRHEQALRMEEIDPGNPQYASALNSVEWFMLGLIDASLAAQNAAIAAESMGLGVCFVGGLRNKLQEVAELLGTPDRVLPLFGLSVGYPAQDVGIKPRLPLDHVYHEETYERDEHRYQTQLTDYNERLSAYYRERTGGKRSESWTASMVAKLRKEQRQYLKSFLSSIRFPID